MRVHPLLASLGLVLAVSAPGALAATLHVPSTYTTIQAAINAASPNDTVQVASGVYVENVQMKGGVSLIGAGYKTTVIDGNGLGNVIEVLDQVNVASFAIEGFTLRNSAKNGSSFTSTGVFVNGKACCTVVCNASIKGCRVSNCEFGIVIANVHTGTLFIEQNIIVGNKYDGFKPYLGNTVLRNNTIVSNGRHGYTDNAGGGSNLLENNIIAFNAGAGIRPHSTTPITILYNDVFGNQQGDYIHANGGSPFTPSPGTGEISADPGFLNAQGGDYSLSTGSPCIDAGNPASGKDPDLSILDMGALWADPAYVPSSTDVYGTACSGLMMGVENEPVLGTSIFTVSLSGAPRTTVATLLVGLSDASYAGVPLPLDMTNLGAPGCFLLLGPIVFAPPLPTGAAGEIVLPLAIPVDVTLMGFPIYLQWMVSDPAANPLGRTFSEGLKFVVGN